MLPGEFANSPELARIVEPRRAPPLDLVALSIRPNGVNIGMGVSRLAPS